MPSLLRCAVGWVSLVIAAAASAGDSLEAQIGQLIAAPAYLQANWGILVVDLDSGEVLYELNADKLFAPASSTKLFTVATALDRLGGDYRFVTPVYRSGLVDPAGQLNGDLILVASGDPTMGGRADERTGVAYSDFDHTYANDNDRAVLTAPDPLAGLDHLARQVAATGIRRVHGDVVVDDSLFETVSAPGSEPSRHVPIMINDNLIDVLVTPTEAGQPAVVQWRPQTALCRIDAQVETTEADRDTDVTVRGEGAGNLVVRGQIPVGHQPLVRVYEFPDPESFARGLFIEALARAGVAVDASVLAGNPKSLIPDPALYAAASMPTVAWLESPPLAESARLILKASHNLHASTLLMVTAAEQERYTLDEALTVERDFLTSAGIDADTLSFSDAYGGSQANYVTPRATVQLLRYMARHSEAQVFREALPLLGVDGTPVKAVGPNSPARGNVRAKTGSVYWPNEMNNGYLLTGKALAGYMTTSRGRRLAFASFVSNVHLVRTGDTSPVAKSLGRLCEIVYEAR